MPQNNTTVSISTVVGYILLTPPLLGVVLFIYTLFDGAFLSSFSREGDFLDSFSRGAFWSGNYNTGGYSSPIPIYLGLMAIAGAYLIKDGKK
jgi:hypothetical protein